MATEVVARIPSPSALAALTARRPGLSVEGVPLHDHLLVQGAAGTRGALEAERDALGLLHASVREGTATYFLAADRREQAALRAMRRLGWVPLAPLRWTRGALEVRLVSEGPKGLPRLLEAGLGVEVLSKRRRAASDASVGRLTTEAVLPSLTPRQAEAVLAALSLGYYEQPRRVTTQEAAKSLGLSRSTFEDHLRRGESQLIRSLGPLLRLRGDPTEGAVGGALEVYARFSASLGLYVEAALRGDRLARVRLTRQRPARAKGTHPYLRRILDHLATGRGDLRGIPVDLEVTPFEREVLEAIRRIPSGKVLTYGELAARLGRPQAARAVGNVCAKNPVPLVIPCHRVVAGDGRLGNYSAEGGPVTKEKLLRLERALPEAPGRKGKPRT